LKQTNEVDFIIVGQGLAGSCLALELLRRNKSILVYDQPQLNRSTSVAAGLFNPITGKMLAKAWLADSLYPYLHSFYKRVEMQLRKEFFFPRPVYRPFHSVEEQNEWMGRSTHPSMKEYIEHIFLASAFGGDVHDPVGGVLVRQSGYVDSMVFVESVRSFLKDFASYREEKFLEEDLQDGETMVSYQQFSAKKIIYCGGVDDLLSRYFSWLPIRPLKGETLLIRMQEIERIYNRGIYVVPGSDPGTFIVGATYDFDLAPSVTAHGKEELETRLNDLIRLPYQIRHQNWGIRATTVDRRPILGPHPEARNIVIFNGLGTKGVSLAPYFSGQLADWLGGTGEIMREVNIKRFKSLYSKFE
jgi:glycine/D-amino acid oxidase-like deaminating enzyme